jgi:hypothetical protein
MKREVEASGRYEMAKVYDFVEMWLGSKNLHATQKKSPAQPKQISAVEYI